MMPEEDTQRLSIDFGEGRCCPVVLGANAIDALATLWNPRWREAAIIGDANVLDLHGPRVLDRLRPLVARSAALAFSPGEAHKTRDTKAALEDQLLGQGFSRQACIVGLGGGISLDLAGFVAATYLRGVPHLNLPTSLLAQVDAAVGGKTGVNTLQGKNLIGAFHQPAAVIIDTEFLRTLPAAEWPGGLAEMVKHAVIGDAELFGWMEREVQVLRRPGPLSPHVLRRCVEIKAEVVRRDERELGLRSVLNFGHTIGHAVERATGHRVSHGQAVGLGMRVEAGVAAAVCSFPEEELLRLSALLSDLGLTERLPGTSFDQLTPYLAQDKKRRDGGLQLALPRRIGAMASGDDRATVPVTADRLREAWESRR